MYLFPLDPDVAIRHATRLNHGFRIALTVQIRSYKEHKNWEQRSFEIMESPSREIIQEKERHIKTLINIEERGNDFITEMERLIQEKERVILEKERVIRSNRDS